MKSKKHPTKEKDEITFPILMEFKDNDFVVFFFSETQGVVVSSEFSDYPVGHYDGYWNSALGKDWHPFEGSITLSN